MPDLIPENEDEDSEERDCWICFVRESVIGIALDPLISLIFLKIALKSN